MSLVVDRVLGLASIQDLGRPGRMHVAVPPAGALVPELLVAANRSVENEDGAAGIELLGQLSVRARGDVQLAVDDGPPRALRANETMTIASGARRCAYLAVRGGVVAPVVLGGRGALLAAGIGGPLRAGAIVDVGDAPRAARLAAASASRATFRGGDTISILPGPDLDAFPGDAIAILTSSSYRISPSSNRVGTRLEGPALPRRAGYRERSRPMIRGALEVPGDGLPIVLGPEHPTTGGYPIVGVIANAELGRFHAIRLGGTVRFTVGRSVDPSPAITSSR